MDRRLGSLLPDTDQALGEPPKASDRQIHDATRASRPSFGMALAGTRLTRLPNTPVEEFREPRAHGEILLMVDGADACVFGP